MNMRTQIAVAATCLVAACAATPPKAGTGAGCTWIDIGGKDVEGRGWSDTELPFDRIPKRFAKDLPRVWGNGISSTGEFFEFESDTTSVAVRTAFAKHGFGENNFNSSAFVGTDLYVFDAARGDWRWAAAAGHGVRWGKNVEYQLVNKLPKQVRRFRLYLPLRNRLASLKLGVDTASKTKLIPPRKAYAWPLGVTEVEAGAPRTFPVTMENRTGMPIAGELEVWMNDDWDVAYPILPARVRRLRCPRD